MNPVQSQTVLLVENDIAKSKALTDIISGFGYKVLQTFSSKETVIKIINNEQINLILINVDLGTGTNGFETAKNILNKKYLPIIFISSHQESKYKELANSISEYGYLDENSSKEAFKITIEMALKLFSANEKMQQHKQALMASRKELQKNDERMKFLADLSLNIALNKYDDLTDYLAQQLKIMTKASYVSIQLYDEQRKKVKVQNIITEKKNLNKLLIGFGKRLKRLEPAMPEEMYHTMIDNNVVKKKSLTDLTCGMIPGHIDKIYRKISGVDRFLGLAFFLEGRLYGSATLGIHAKYPDPPKEFLYSFGRIAAIALKKKITTDEFLLSESNYKREIKKFNDAIVVIDENKIVRYITDSIEVINGFKAEEIKGHPFSEFIFSEDISRVEDQFKKSLKGELSTYEFRGRRKNEGVVWIRISSRAVNLEEYGNRKGIRGVVVDITQEKFALEKIFNLLNEKALLLKEVHHRIKNNMIMVSSLLNIQAKKFDDPKVVNAFEDTAQRVHSMMVLYDHLYRDNNFTELSVQIYFTSLIQEIMATLAVIGDLEITYDIEDRKLPVKILTNLGIIVNETITNIVKHSMNDNEKNNVHLQYLKKDDKHLIKIIDNSTGLSEDFSFEKAKTFGLQLIQILVQQIGGTINYEKASQNITTIQFHD